MSSLNINIDYKIKAAIVGGNRTVSSGISEILDPVTDSYSNVGTINFWLLTIINTDPGILTSTVSNNGKNSVFNATGSGNVTVQLEVRDDQGNIDFTTIIITII